jgi:hypothetical protein
MSTPSRAPAGTPAFVPPGPHDPATAELFAEMERAQLARFHANQRCNDVTMRTVGALIRREHPTAASFELDWDDESRCPCFVDPVIRDGEGNELYDGGQDDDALQEEVHQLVGCMDVSPDDRRIRFPVTFTDLDAEAAILASPSVSADGPHEQEAVRAFVAETEQEILRTDSDIGANPNALGVWNRVRQHAGLPRLQRRDLTSVEEYNDPGRDAISERSYPLQPRAVDGSWHTGAITIHNEEHP